MKIERKRKEEKERNIVIEKGRQIDTETDKEIEGVGE